MRNLLMFILTFGCFATLCSQNPHGAALKIDCASCHTSGGWEISASYWQNLDAGSSKVANSTEQDVVRFHHNKTNFELTGRHQTVDCRTCHESLVFTQTSTACISCHADVHQQTVGIDCARCHTASNWLVDDIQILHFNNGFPLLGVHATANCNDCHQSETNLQFERIGNDCINCHLDKYTATTMPNHTASGLSTDCVVCHDMAGDSWLWTPGSASHLFFPLTKGHQIDDCNQCHTGGTFSNTPADCFACHETDFRATASPDHEAGNFSTQCTTCHNTDPGWNATDYTQHDQDYFRIYSGKHEGEWNQCTDCHTTPNDYKLFSCTDCHEHNNAGKLANKHDDVAGYSFSSTACYSCHPKG